MNSSAPVRTKDIAGAVRSLGLENRPVCLHSSLRSFGFVEGGAEAVIQGFLDEGCTVMVPTFTDTEVALRAFSLLESTRGARERPPEPRAAET